MKDLGIGIIHLSNEILVRTDQPEDAKGRQYTINYTVTVPDHFKIFVENINGSVTVTGINNYVEVDNINGMIDVVNIVGSVSANLVNGMISGKVTLPQNGEIDMEVVNGSINLDIPDDTSAELSASVVVGTISITGLTVQNVKNTLLTYECTLRSGQGEINLQTVNGNINVKGF